MTYELDTRALRYFVAVATYKSYTLAAAHLRITQPAITRQIQAFEKEFGVRLFRRQARRMVLTESGEVLLEQAKEIIERIEAAGTLAKQAAGEPIGRLTIGAPSAAGELFLPPILASYRSKFPRVFLNIVTAYSGDLAEMLADGRIDLALIFGEPSHADLDMQPLIDVGLGLVAPANGVLPNDPTQDMREIELARAAALPLIFPGRSQTLRTVVDQACRQIGATPNVVMESNALAISKALVKSGLGFMFLGLIGVRSEVAAGELRFIPISPPAINWRLSLATRRSKSNSLAARMMMKEVIAALRPGTAIDHR